jgi:hypothetical protein
MRPFVAYALCSIASAVFGEMPGPPRSPFQDLPPDDHIYSVITLAPGEKRDLNISSPVSEVVGFEPDITLDQMAKYLKPGSRPVILWDRNSATSIEGDYGDGRRFEPKDGVIQLQIKNGYGIALRFAIWTSAPDLLSSPKPGAK